MIYVAIYAAGIPVVRTLVWLASIVGLVLMLVTADGLSRRPASRRCEARLGRFCRRRCACRQRRARAACPIELADLCRQRRRRRTRVLCRKRRRDGHQQRSAAAGQRRRARRHRAVDGQDVASLRHADVQMPRWRRHRRRNWPPARSGRASSSPSTASGDDRASAGRGAAAPETLPLAGSRAVALRCRLPTARTDSRRLPWDVFALKGCQE